MARPVDDDEAAAQEVLIRLLAGASAEEILQDHPGPAPKRPPTLADQVFDRTSRPPFGSGDSTVPNTPPIAQKPGNALAVRMGAAGPKPPKKK